MPCYRPIKAYRAALKNATGRRSLVFNPRDALPVGHPGRELEVPCGQCIGCRLERSRQWAARCIHEAQLYDQNCFITLTYSEEHLPENGSLVLKDFQDFMKRLRKRFGSGIRFFHCGEYGDQYSRPHYHACLFNFDFPDKELLRGDLFTSKALCELWPFGFSTVGQVTFESAAYVARYVTKKISGAEYSRVHMVNGKFVPITPEYATMSRRPGIGRGWYDKFRSDVYPSDEVVLRGGKKMKPPKAYDRYFEVDNPEVMAELKLQRTTKAEEKAALESYDRLAVKEECAELNFRRISRSYEK